MIFLAWALIKLHGRMECQPFVLLLFFHTNSSEISLGET